MNLWKYWNKKSASLAEIEKILMIKDGSQNLQNPIGESLLPRLLDGVVFRIVRDAVDPACRSKRVRTFSSSNARAAC